MIHRTVIAALFLLAALLAGCSEDTAPGTSGSADRIFKAVDKYQFNTADSSFAKLIIQDSTSPSSYYGRGFSYERQLMLIDAMNYYLQALQRDSNYAPAYTGLAHVYTWLGAEVEAADAAGRAATLLKTDPDAWLTLANALIAHRQFTEANQALQQAEATGVNPKVVALIQARAAFLQNDHATEQSLMARAAGNEDSKAYLTALADYYEVRGLSDSAMMLSRRIFEDDESQDNLIAHFFRALRTGYQLEGRQMLAIMDKRDKSRTLPTAARYFYFTAVGDRFAASQAAEDLDVCRPGCLTNMMYQFDARAKNFDHSGAGTTSDQLIFVIEQSRLPEHLKMFCFSRTVAVQSRYAPAPVGIALMDTIVDPTVTRETEFQASYARALKSGTGFMDFDKRYTDYMAAHDNDPALLTRLAAFRTELRTTTIPEADSLYQKALTINSGYSPALQGMVNMYLRWNNPGAAVAAFDRYPEFAQQNPQLALLKAVALAEANRADEAVSVASAALPQVAGNTDMLNALVRALVRHQQLNQAAAVAAQAQQLRRDDPDVCAAAAYVAAESGKWDDAIEHADHGLSLEPEHAWLQAEKARALAGSGKREDATKLFESLIGDRAHVEALLYYSRLLAENKADSLRAQELAREAVGDARLYHRGWLNLSYVYLVTGRYDLARGAATKSLEAIPDDPEGYYLLGMALFNEKNTDARVALEKAVALGLTGDKLQQAQTTLSQI